jgi:thiamine biosynthesis lipoprotein
MGCEVVVGGAAVRCAAAIEDLFARREARFSRFLATSELSHVNGAGAGTLTVSAEMARMLTLALTAAGQTDGLVDPTLGGSLTAIGYDRDFARIGDDPRPPGRTRPGCWQEVELTGRVLRRPAGVGLDLNCVVKGQTVDDALELAGGRGWVSAGGDIACVDGVDVALPGGGAVHVVGGLATSGSGRRRWRRGGQTLHHLLDPRTGTPVASPWEQVTVAGASCIAADVAAKAAFVAGAGALAWLESRGLPGRLLRADGTAVESAAWAAGVAGAVACT